MIFSSLTLNNIGLYKGENFFDLIPKNGKNIILFGGKNGSGKTTLLESIKLCLYGNHIYGLTKKEYENFIRKIIHRGENKGAIELEFSYFTETSEEKYQVVRKFNIDKKFKEEFILFKNGEILKDIPKDYWQDFILDLIPAGLVNFFFFDGEKIEKLADDFTEISFIEDIKNLIGVSLIDELYASLAAIEKKYLKEESISNTIFSDIQNKEEEIHNLETVLQKYIQDRAQLNQKLNSIQKELKRVEKEFYQKGGKFFKNYEELKLKRELLKSEIENIKNEIKTFSSHDLPLAVGLELVEDLINQLEVEREIKLFQIKQKLLKQKLEELKVIIKDTNLPEEKIKQIEKTFLLKDKPKGKIIHNLAENELDQIKSVYKNLKEMIIPKSKELFQKLEDLEEELVQTEIALQTVPKEEILAPYIKRISELEKEKASLEIEIKTVEEKIKETEDKIKKAKKELDKLQKVIAQKSKNQRVLELIHKSQRVLQKFKKEFIKRKLLILKREILESLAMLERKEDFIVDLDIDPETFEINIYDKFKRKIPFDRISAGERQIFAISFLWGLAKTSGKALPVIVDTPLGRLDSEHRKNLVKNYYPNISHQVILLSTDTEVDEGLYNLMKEHISHSYHLIYDNECMCTKVEKGYFWKEENLIGVNNEI